MSCQNVWRNLKEMMEFPKEGIFSKVLASTGKAHYTLMCLSKGTKIDTHTSTKNGCVQCLFGKGLFTLFDEPIPLREGVFIAMPAHAPHALEAEENLAILLCLHE
ncbi:MAG: cupin domain-containing protein [Candidatus Omnitrophica bacterium]|nr:cupin domain-containing protein [Candidatus Omnitrophota bacterium]